jgi:SAM-dependent methyltransferase
MWLKSMDKETQKNLLDIVKKNYEEIAEDFSETRKKYLWPELIKLASQVKGGDKILDVGCGNGRLLEAFKDKEISYAGVDSSEKLIELARERFLNNFKFKILNLKFIVGDILELDKLLKVDSASQRGASFDYIFCVAVLHHIPGEALRAKVLENLREKLKDDGRIILTVWNLWSQKKFRKFIFRFAFLKLIGRNHRLGHRSSGASGTGKMDFGDIVFDWKNSAGQAISQRYYHAFNIYELKKIIKKAGLNIERIYKDKYNYYVIASRAPLQMGHMRIK